MSLPAKEWIENDALFRQQLVRGRRAEFSLAVDLLDRGFGVKLGRLEFREAYGQPGFENQADVLVGGGHLLEVKARSLEFHSPEDFPFATINVCALNRWRRRERKPCAFVFLSEPTGAWLVLPLVTQDRWDVATTHDPQRGISEYRVMRAPRSCLVPYEAFLLHLGDSCGKPL
jgi:hypothetical protein